MVENNLQLANSESNSNYDSESNIERNNERNDESIQNQFIAKFESGVRTADSKEGYDSIMMLRGTTTRKNKHKMKIKMIY